MALSPSDPASGSQTHPLEATDLAIAERLLAVSTPEEEHLVDAARLLARYEGFPGALAIQEDLAKALRLWGLSRDQLQARTRAIWAAGFRPSPAAAVEDPVGSGFDTADREG